MKTKKFLFLIVICISWLSNQSLATTYYVNSETGNDNYTGLSPSNPFKTLQKANTIKLDPGDSLLLASGFEYNGGLKYFMMHGTVSKPIVISSYQLESNTTINRPIINAIGRLQGILLQNCSYIELSNIEIYADAKGSRSYVKQDKKQMRCGVIINVTKPGEYNSIYLDNLLVRDIYYEMPGYKRGSDEVKTANGTQNYGWGIRFITKHEQAVISDIRITNCEVKNVSHTGLKFTAKVKNGIRNVLIKNNIIYKTGGPGMQFSKIQDGHIHYNSIDQSGDNSDSRKWGRGSGLWTWGSNNVLIEHNRFTNSSGPGDSAGAHIDFNCTNIVLQYNFSANNAGGFCEILGNNYNCAYRYNISVNDGYREKGENGAFQEGKTFWLSGFVGKGKKRKGPFNSYIYNNTIYVNKDIASKIAIDKAASGVLIVNNIFCIEGGSKPVLGDQYKPEKGGNFNVKYVIFENNLFYSQTSWSDHMPIQDAAPIYGNPDFSNPGGFKIEDYYPRYESIIKDKGIPVPMIPFDSVGLTIGLQVSKDIIGNKIIGLPDMGAIELKDN